MVQPRLTELDDQKPSSWYGFHEEQGFINSLNVFPLFRDCYSASCLKNEAINHLKANFAFRKASRVFLDYTHRSAVCAHFERYLPPSLWTIVLQISETVYHLNL